METFMRLKRNNDSLVLDLIGNGINSIEFDIHLRSINALKNFDKLYINFAYLSSVNNETINKLKKLNNVLKDKIVALINVTPMQNTIFNLFGIDKIFQIYMNKLDAIEGKKPIVNRNFRIV